MQNKTPQEIYDFLSSKLHFDPVANAAIFNTMRILKRLNKGDTYYENYMWHWEKRGSQFVDYYHLLWQIGSQLEINNILEIGCRTGISLCQLFSSMRSVVGKKIYLFDVFNDGYLSPELVKMNLKALNLPTENVEFKIGDSRETIPKFVMSTDLRFQYVLVDGCHERDVAIQDLNNIVPLLDQGGILFFDDLTEDGCNLFPVWQEFKKQHPEEFLFLENTDGKGIGIGVKL